MFDNQFTNKFEDWVKFFIEKVVFSDEFLFQSNVMSVVFKDDINLIHSTRFFKALINFLSTILLLLGADWL